MFSFLYVNLFQLLHLRLIMQCIMVHIIGLALEFLHPLIYLGLGPEIKCTGLCILVAPEFQCVHLSDGIFYFYFCEIHFRCIYLNVYYYYHLLLINVICIFVFKLRFYTFYITSDNLEFS